MIPRPLEVTRTGASVPFFLPLNKPPKMPFFFFLSARSGVFGGGLDDELGCVDGEAEDLDVEISFLSDERADPFAVVGVGCSLSRFYRSPLKKAA
jgi:hypothetical protein